jgi:hypothetical protein
LPRGSETLVGSKEPNPMKTPPYTVGTKAPNSGMFEGLGNPCWKQGTNPHDFRGPRKPFLDARVKPMGVCEVLGNPAVVGVEGLIKWSSEDLGNPWKYETFGSMNAANAIGISVA